MRFAQYSLLAFTTMVADLSPARADFLGLGDLPGGAFESLAQGVSSDGSVVVGRATSASGQEAFRWTRAAGMVSLGDLPGGIVSSYAYSASANGSVVVGQGISANGPEAFRWTMQTGMVGLSDVPGGTFDSLANAVSANGSVAVGYVQSGLGHEAARWTQSTGWVGIGDFPGGGFFSDALGVSADGSIVVGRGDSANGGDAFRWSQATGMQSLGPEPGGGHNSSANAISADGAVIVGNYSGGAFRWTQATGMVPIGELYLGRGSRAWGVSADGNFIVGDAGDAVGTGTEAFIWDPVHGMRNLEDVLVNEQGLDLTGWDLESALDISADGRTFVGAGFGPNGNGLQAWVAATVPEPSALILATFGALAILAAGLKRGGRAGGSGWGLLPIPPKDPLVARTELDFATAKGIMESSPSAWENGQRMSS